MTRVSINLHRSHQSRWSRMVRRVVATTTQLCAIVLVSLPVLVSCADANAVAVQLRSSAPYAKDPRRLTIQAQITGPTDGLRYRWFAVTGLFDPQESASPTTDYRFDNRSLKDRVTVEVWRGETRVARSELDVTLDTHLAQISADPMPALQVSITTIPSYSAQGGTDTKEDIRGTVTGEIAAGDQVIVYARADAWYIQPSPLAKHAIKADGTWETWTHTGSSYAAFVVRSGYVPFQRLDVLPLIEGDVLARVVVEGVRK